MKKKITLTVFFLCVLSLVVFTNPSKPPAGAAGLPGGNDCTSCHNGTVNTGPGSTKITYSGLNNIYKADSTYTLSIDVNQNGISTFGFEMAIVDTNYVGVGTLTVTNTSTTYAFTTSGVIYGSHKNAGTTNHWDLKWKAPAATKYKGKIMIGCSGLAANSNGRDNGDQCYTDNIILNPVVVNGVSAASADILPLQASYMGEQTYRITCNELNHAAYQLSLISLDGKQVWNETITGSQVMIENLLLHRVYIY